MTTSTPSKASSNKKAAPSPGTSTPTKQKIKHDRHHQEASPNGRAKCQRCRKNIGKGQQRKGIDYGEGYRWWHKECFDKFEHKYSRAPTDKAICKECKKKIDKGAWRVGKEIYAGPKEGRYIEHYYHVECVSAAEKERLKLPPQPRPPQVGAASSSSSIDENDALRGALKRLRSVFASRLSCVPMKIYSDTLIDDLVDKMPKNEDELLKIPGIGVKKCKSFGSSILTVLQRHRKKKKNDIRTWFRPKQTQEVEVVETLSCEEIVNRKFEDAKKNGYAIECD